LNPYLKNGDGFPQNNNNELKKEGFGDNGLTWWTKALERCYELSKSTGKSVQEIASERYGSLESLKMKIEDAKAKNKSTLFMRPGDSDGRSSYRSRNEPNNWRKSTIKRTESPPPSKDEDLKRKRKITSPPPIKVKEEEKAEDLDLNQLGAKLIKAELMEDEEMIVKLKRLIEIARTRPSSTETKSKNKEQEILIASRTDRFGNEMPIRKTEFDKQQKEKDEKKNKEKFNQYSKDGKQIDKYFADDNKYSLKDLVERERQITTDDNNYMYSSIQNKKVFLSLFNLLLSLSLSLSKYILFSHLKQQMKILMMILLVNVQINN